MVWAPIFLGSLMTVPLVLIGRLYGSALWGFTAAILGGVAWNYYERTMAGYFELRNKGDRGVKLEGAEAEFAGMAMLHGTETTDDGQRRMVHLGSAAAQGGPSSFTKPGNRRDCVVQCGGCVKQDVWARVQIFLKMFFF